MPIGAFFFFASWNVLIASINPVCVVDGLFLALTCNIYFKCSYSSCKERGHFGCISVTKALLRLCQDIARALVRHWQDIIEALLGHYWGIAKTLQRHARPSPRYYRCNTSVYRAVTDIFIGIFNYRSFTSHFSDLTFRSNFYLCSLRGVVFVYSYFVGNGIDLFFVDNLTGNRFSCGRCDSECC